MRKILAALFGVLSIAAAAFGVYLCTYADTAVTVIEDGAGGPTETLQSFFSGLETQDWDTAYALLYNYSSLGFENGPEDEVSAMFWRAQQDAWKFKVEDGYEMNGTALQKSVTVTCLDMEKIQQDIAEKVQSILELRVSQAKLKSDVYDDNGAYRQDVAMDALKEAAAEILQDTSAYEYETDIKMQLRHENGGWLVGANDALISALTSGAVR